jgi:hypothetical protein
MPYFQFPREMVRNSPQNPAIKFRPKLEMLLEQQVVKEKIEKNFSRVLTEKMA